MVKHNNQLPNQHFHKDWQSYVKTWFDQAARKKRRRNARAEKARRIAPRPVEGSLRPVVHGQTVRYARKIRRGRGFTLDELKEAGINRHYAATVGICVDHRRKNRSEKSLRENVQRLKEYQSRLVVFPRHAKHPKAGDASKADCDKASQLRTAIVPLRKATPKSSHIKVADVTTKMSVFEKLRRARADARLIGVRKRRAEKKAEADLLKKK